MTITIAIENIFPATFTPFFLIKIKEIIKNKRYYEISTMYECVETLSMIIGYKIRMVCLELN